VGFYLALISIAALIASFRIDDLADFSGPVVVRLGSPEGVDAPRPVEQPAPTAEPARPAQPEPPEPTPPQPALASAQKPAPTPKPVPAAATTPAVQPAVSQPAVATPPAPVVFKGSESGNSYDMTIDAGSGTAKPSLYVPINLFLPLPFDVAANVFDAIPDLAGLPGTAEQRKQVFKSSYSYNEKDGRWQLKNNKQPKYDARPELWTMLEEGGYDLRKAEYKLDKHLRPVVILFKVSPVDTRGAPRLEDVLVESSSGYSDIDEAVLHGFRKAEFSNSGTISIKGRFTYRF
jgi:outer membrane biosynthesis protein TonB